FPEVIGDLLRAVAAFSVRPNATAYYFIHSSLHLTSKMISCAWRNPYASTSTLHRYLHAMNFEPGTTRFSATNAEPLAAASTIACDTDKELKDESLALIDKARDRTGYSSVSADVAALMQKIDSAIAAEKVGRRTLPPLRNGKRLSRS